MKTHTLLALLLVPGLSLTSPLSSRAAEEKAHDHAQHGHTATADVPIPATLPALWTAINEHHHKLTDTVVAKKLAEADPHIDALDALVKALPTKSSELPEAKQKTVAGMVKNADTALDALHEAAEANKQDVAAAKLKQFDGVVKILKAQYSAEALGQG